MKRRRRSFSEWFYDFRMTVSEFFFVIVFGLLALFAVTTLCVGIIYMAKAWG